jgi:hypothetical protein
VAAAVAATRVVAVVVATRVVGVMEDVEGEAAVMVAVAEVEEVAEVSCSLKAHVSMFQLVSKKLATGMSSLAGGRMQADEANFQPSQTSAHITPIIKQITQLSLDASQKTQMPSVRSWNSLWLIAARASIAQLCRNQLCSHFL